MYISYRYIYIYISPYFILYIFSFFTLIFLSVNSLALCSTAALAAEILMCRDYELRNRHAPRLRVSGTTQPDRPALYMHIDEMPSIFFFIHASRVPRIIHDNPRPSSGRRQIPRAPSPFTHRSRHRARIATLPNGNSFRVPL